MKWKTLVFAFFLVAAAVAVTVNVAATPIFAACLNLRIDAFDLSNLLLDGGAVPTGGGDPLPGGGIPR